MSEEEATVEAGECTTVESGADAADADDAAASFLELDADLDTGQDPETGADSGHVADAERVPRERCPDGYPLGARTDEVLALTVDIGLDERVVYLAWPDEATDAPLVWYLDATGIELRELYGREVQLAEREGHTTLATPAEAPRGSGRWYGGVLGGAALSAGLLATLPAAGPTLGPPLGLLWGALTLVGLPYAVYRDAWYVRTHSDWDGGPLFWATLSALPLLNLVSVASYLYSRSKANFFGFEPSLRTRVVDAVRSLL
ncbi:hypothetical protein [Haloarcula salinisoli]|uniref:Uncharacterized protein n=1 Tax=Haloarcula salinisoli TaxID=2487746 RepID=A0A8J8CAJ7_9EURY|nr:hypothetical protein [Halomicroarcula salinisoli]MBX0288189.1 hypothetical protein [Halomicroarcula salinisoli]MBX0305339.1 hypothetical protein [Halomicroarcula salinisoli]